MVIKAHFHCVIRRYNGQNRQCAPSNSIKWNEKRYRKGSL